jgi:hypothetical protein
MTRMDSTRLGKGFGYMIRALPNMQQCQYIAAAEAVLEHHFNNHDNCGPWCQRKRLTADARITNERYYRCKKKDAKLYSKLKEIFARFVTFDRLMEVAHGMDTQVNDSFNNTASWFASSKNKVYCGTRSLANRIGMMAVGITSIGLVDYFQRLMKTYGIRATPNTIHFWNTRERNRSKRLAHIQTRDAKKLWLKRKYEQLHEDEKQAKSERAKRDGMYQSGQNMKDVEEDADAGATKKRKSEPCPHCKKMGHRTKRSRKCLLYTAQAPGTPVVEDIAEEEARNIDALEDIQNYETVPILENAPATDTDIGIIRSVI